MIPAYHRIVVEKLAVKRESGRKFITSYIQYHTHNAREMIDLYLAVMRGDPVVERKKKHYPACIGDRLHAADWLVNQAWGKPQESLKVEGTLGLVDILAKVYDEVTSSADTAAAEAVTAKADARIP